MGWGRDYAGIMAASEGKRVVDGPGAFHPRCSANVELSNERRVASGTISPAFALSKDQIPTGLQFSVKILKHSRLVYVSPISASSDLTHQMHLTRLEVLRM